MRYSVGPSGVSGFEEYQLQQSGYRVQGLSLRLRFTVTVWLGEFGFMVYAFQLEIWGPERTQLIPGFACLVSESKIFGTSG